ncbi:MULTISPECIES: magnesium/cobalt transporter CorA [Planktothricoides]|uniref:Magnesium transport protein CorA n=2 Tax=Planktothricoides raciborskii TaxID=132608 RepID=A0AAU8JGS6_9CYAN|nr:MULTISPECIES: magnesium/cobalt transporter CorA [Planktothricoides]MBD2543778.1 magnesium/cobalt transporter CorA [Planktothricoides raciborskii FACHB-1370]MBD2582327.1 magnesium/cobalt transporter CorA [Planktothricoides raciborskii FACHB-1261]
MSHKPLPNLDIKEKIKEKINEKGQEKVTEKQHNFGGQKLEQEIEAEDKEEDYFDYFYDEPGSAPGTLTIESDAAPTKIVLIDYNLERATRVRINQPEECYQYLDTESVSWVDIQGLGNEATWQRIGGVFHLHPLVLEDVVNVPQRPKVEEYQEQLLIIAHMVMPMEDQQGFYLEQVSFVLSKHYLLTVQEEPEHDCFGLVRSRIRSGKGMIRKHGADFLAYALLDAIIDGFFPVLEDYGERIEELEDEVVANPSRKTLEKIYEVRRELLALRRAIWPQRHSINRLIRDDSKLISQDVRIYLRDCYDHVTQVIDLVETYRELTSGLMDVYLSAVSNKMNDVMKLLTIISTIFIPLTFIVGVYGMNFNPDASPFNMPELNSYWGYVGCWGVMIAIALSLVYFFWRRGWFENFSSVDKD